MSQKALQEVEKKVLSQAKNTNFQMGNYIGGKNRQDLHEKEKSKLHYCEMTVPTTRKIFKEGFSFSEQGQELKIWYFIFQTSRIFEAKLMALMHLRKLSSEVLLEDVKILKGLVDHVDNWAISDELSHIYSRLLEYSPKTIWPMLVKWNKSKNLWHRRQSIVGMLNYARMRKKTPPVKAMLKMIENLVEDESFYVQRGVGWSLREVYNVDPKQQVVFVKKHLTRISPIAWYATSEFYPLKLKKQLVESRKENRRRYFSSL